MEKDDKSRFFTSFTFVQNHKYAILNINKGVLKRFIFKILCIGFNLPLSDFKIITIIIKRIIRLYKERLRYN